MLATYQQNSIVRLDLGHVVSLASGSGQAFRFCLVVWRRFL